MLDCRPIGIHITPNDVRAPSTTGTKPARVCPHPGEPIRDGEIVDHPLESATLPCSDANVV